jgi:hypothetical protein
MTPESRVAQLELQLAASKAREAELEEALRVAVDAARGLGGKLVRAQAALTRVNGRLTTILALVDAELRDQDSEAL